MACWILVPQPGMEPTSTLEVDLITDPPGNPFPPIFKSEDMIT